MSFQVKKHTVICSLHFKDEDLEHHAFSGRWFVKPGCRPSVFNCWKHKPYLVPKSQKKRKLNKFQLRDMEVDACDTAQTKTGSEDPMDITMDHTSEQIMCTTTTTSADSLYEAAEFEEIQGPAADASTLKADILALNEQLKNAQKKSKNLKKHCQTWSSA